MIRGQLAKRGRTPRTFPPAPPPSLFGLGRARFGRLVGLGSSSGERGGPFLLYTGVVMIRGGLLRSFFLRRREEDEDKVMQAGFHDRFVSCFPSPHSRFRKNIDRNTYIIGHEKKPHRTSTVPYRITTRQSRKLRAPWFMGKHPDGFVKGKWHRAVAGLMIG